MKTHSTSELRGFAKIALLVSAAFPLSTLIAVSPAHADESVTVNSAETANDVNAKIGAAQAAPDRNIAITISTKGEVVSPGSQIILAPAAGQGDRKIAFSKAGSIGAVYQAGAVRPESVV